MAVVDALHENKKPRMESTRRVVTLSFFPRPLVVLVCCNPLVQIDIQSRVAVMMVISKSEMLAVLDVWLVMAARIEIRT